MTFCGPPSKYDAPAKRPGLVFGVCPTCDGKGGQRTKVCDECVGFGRVIVGRL